MMMKKGLASQKKQACFVVAYPGSRDPLSLMSKSVSMSAWPDLVTKLTYSNFYYPRDFFREMLHGSFVSYRFVFLTCVAGAAYLL